MFPLDVTIPVSVDVIQVPKLKVNASINKVTTVKEGEKTLVFSTSMTKGINFKNFNDRYNGGTAWFRRYHGGKARHIKHYVSTHLHEERPDNVIIHVGGNDLPTKKYAPVPVAEIADHIIQMAQTCDMYGAKKVCISSVLPRKAKYMQHRCKDLHLCRKNDFIFINNSDINLDHLENDGVHLNKSGTELLENNFLNVLNARVLRI